MSFIPRTRASCAQESPQSMVPTTHSVPVPLFQEESATPSHHPALLGTFTQNVTGSIAACPILSLEPSLSSEDLGT